MKEKIIDCCRLFIYLQAGFDDENENCLVWLHHYPRIDGLDACLSTHSLATIMSLLDLNDLNVTLTRYNF